MTADNSRVEISVDTWGEVMATIHEILLKLADLTAAHGLDPRASMAIVDAVSILSTRDCGFCTCSTCVALTRVMTEAAVRQYLELDLGDLPAWVK